jgi:hypothetical protein
MENARYEVLCSLAILLKITANLYVHRRGTRYSKRGQARRQQGIPQAARQSARRKKRGSIGCVYTKGVESMREKVAVDSKRGRQGSGAGVSAGVAETRVRPFNKSKETQLLR